MIKRNIWFRRKGKFFIAEGMRNGKTIYLFQLPSPEELIKQSFFTREKRAKIMLKINSLDYKTKKVTKQASKVRTRNIVRTPEKD